MKARIIDEWRSNPHARLFLAALVFLCFSLITAIPVLAAGGIDSFSQCANGGVGTPEPWCPGTGTGWTNGNVNTINGQWQPGEMVPQRVAIKGLTAGTTYSITISWQAWQDSKTAHSYDYIGTYSETGHTVQPCDGITGCVQASPTMTYPIPADPSLKLACGFPGHNPTYPRPLWFTVWNGNITALSNYTYSTSKFLTANDGIDGSGCLITTTTTYTGLTITFVPTTSISDTVIAWAGHIASDTDWGTGYAAPSITGASYHMYLVACGDGINGCGSQDNQVSIGASTTAVRLSKFGVLEVVPAQVTLDWKTASEINTAGFNVYRSESVDGPYVRINSQLIPASTDSLVGGKYEYQDTTVSPGKTYYYQLEDVEYNGASTRHPAVSVTVAATPGLGNAAGGMLIGLGLLAFATAAAGFLILQKKSSAV